MTNDQIVVIPIKNLDYKELRKKPATGVAYYPAPPFDVVTWTKNVNNNFGPNYFIDTVGNVYQLLPHEYHGNGDVKEEDRHNLIVMVANSEVADKEYKNLVSLLAPILAEKPKNKNEDTQADKTDTEQSEVTPKSKK